VAFRPSACEKISDHKINHIDDLIVGRKSGDGDEIILSIELADRHRRMLFNRRIILVQTLIFPNAKRRKQSAGKGL